MYKNAVPGAKVAPAASEYGAGSKSSPLPTPDAVVLSEADSARIEAQLSPEQLQLFAEENDSMLRHYEDTLGKVQYVFLPLFLLFFSLGFRSVAESSLLMLISPGTRRNHSSKSPPCKKPLSPISPRKKSTSHSSSATSTRLRRTSGEVIASSSARPSAGVRRRQCSGARSGYARGSWCGIWSFDPHSKRMHFRLIGVGLSIGCSVYQSIPIFILTFPFMYALKTRQT